MTLDFSKYLSADQRKSIIESRLQQFATEAYQHSINLELAKKINDADAIKSSEDALAVLTNAIAVHEAELKTI